MRFSRAYQHDDLFYRPCYNECIKEECSEVCYQDFEPMYKVLSRHPSSINFSNVSIVNFSNASNSENPFILSDAYFIQRSRLDPQLESNSEAIKKTHYYVDTHFYLSPSSFQKFAPEYNDVCMRIDPCVGAAKDAKVCCPDFNYSPKLNEHIETPISEQASHMLNDFQSSLSNLQIKPYDSITNQFVRDQATLNTLINEDVIKNNENIIYEEERYEKRNLIYKVVAWIVIILGLVLLFVIIIVFIVHLRIISL